MMMTIVWTKYVMTIPMRTIAWFAVPECRFRCIHLLAPSLSPPDLLLLAGVFCVRADGANLRDICGPEPNASAGRQDVPKSGVGLRDPCVSLASPALQSERKWRRALLCLDHPAVHVFCVLELGECLSLAAEVHSGLSSTVGLGWLNQVECCCWSCGSKNLTSYSIFFNYRFNLA